MAMATSTSFKIESGVQLLSRLIRKPLIENFYPALFQNGPNPGEVIEIFSDTDISYLLYDIICEALLLASFESNGSIGVLFFNCCGNFNPNRFLNYMRDKIKTTMKKKNMDVLDEELQNDVFRKMLCNFYILEIYDGVQLYTTIHNLESVFVHHPNIAMIIFDNITAFYWSEQHSKITKMDMYLKNVLQIIQKVTKEYKITILYTRPEYFSSSKDTIENLEPCSKTPNLDKINHRIQIVQFNNSVYQVIIGTFQKLLKAMFFIDGDIIKWEVS